MKIKMENKIEEELSPPFMNLTRRRRSWRNGKRDDGV